MERKRVSLEPILQGHVISLGNSLRGILDVLTDHEQRLQRLEGAGEEGSGLGLSRALVVLEAKIQAMTDEGKRRLAYDHFIDLCDILGMPMEASA